MGTGGQGTWVPTIDFAPLGAKLIEGIKDWPQYPCDVHIGTGVIVSCGFFQCLPVLGGFFVFIRSQLPSDTGTELSVEYWPANRGKYCLTLLERIYLLMYFSIFYTHMKGFLDCFLDCNEKRTCYSGFRGVFTTLHRGFTARLWEIPNKLWFN